MSHEKPTEDIRELAALYSLGALTQHEAQSFETHIREDCPVCKAELFKFRHITAGIGLAANEAETPADTRELLLARIGREAPSRKPQVDREKPKSATAPRPVLTQVPANRTSIFPWILVALFAALAAIAFLSYRSQQSANDRVKSNIFTLEKDFKDLQDLYVKENERQGALEEVISAASRPETRIFRLKGLTPAPASSGAILWDVQLKKCLVFGYMPPAAPGRAYQLWYMTPEAKIPSGTLEQAPSGNFYDWFPVPEGIASATMVITLEPESGSKEPTGSYYAIGRNE